MTAKKKKKSLDEYKWVKDVYDDWMAMPEADRQKEILEFMLKKAREKKDEGNN